jgi:hypothetical protein
MSEKEAEEVLRKFLEYKMMWHSQDNYANKYDVHHAMNVLGPKKVDEITKEFHKIWNEE